MTSFRVSGWQLTCSSRKGEKHVFCEICQSDISIGHVVVIDPAWRQTASMQALMSIVEQLAACVRTPETRDALSVENCNYQSAGVADLPVFDQEERVDVFWTAMERMLDPTSHRTRPSADLPNTADDSPWQSLL